jgi:hypothetical protein
MNEPKNETPNVPFKVITAQQAKRKKSAVRAMNGKARPAMKMKTLPAPAHRADRCSHPPQHCSRSSSREAVDPAIAASSITMTMPAQAQPEKPLVRNNLV